MIAEFSLLIFLVSLWLQFAFTVAALRRARNHTVTPFLPSPKLLCFGVFLTCGVAFIGLIIGFLTDDFSIAYVAGNSAKELPWYYKFSATWGGHEGSMLLWYWIATIWQCLYFFKSDHNPAMRYTSSSILSILLLVMGLFIVLTSNPFERLMPIPPQQGTDLNPLLQDIGLIIHPPILYIGYVGLMIPFAIALSALILRLEYRDWRGSLQPWINAIWGFLTLGIGLGSWWAYRELGWGGWWFWDPVENVSLMPWIATTVLIHWTAKRSHNQIYSRAVPLLAIMPFCLVLLGLFTVRSGLLTSVHSFANSPQRGLYLLAILFLTTISALSFYARRDVTTRQKFVRMQLLDFLLLAQGIILLSMLFVIFLGTYYPLLYEIFDLGILSVGAPYFNQFIKWLVLPLFLFLPLNVFHQIQRDKIPLLVSAIIAFCATLLSSGFFIKMTQVPLSFSITLGLFIGYWGVLVYSLSLFRHYKKQGIVFLSQPAFTMHLAHFAFAVIILAISANSYSTSREVLLYEGESIKVAQFRFTLRELRQQKKDNFIAQQAIFHLHLSDKKTVPLVAEKRAYFSGSSTTEAGILSYWFADLYITIGQKQGQGYSFKIQIKPLANLLWIAIVLLAFSGFLRAIQYRKATTSE